MSFDVFFQRFADGDQADGGGEAMREVLRPYVARAEPAHDHLTIEYGDGSADVYLDGDGMMANHVSGTDPWDLLVQGARAAGWVILPVDGPTCIVTDDQRDHLPEPLRDDVVLVTTGADLLRAIGAD